MDSYDSFGDAVDEQLGTLMTGNPIDVLDGLNGYLGDPRDLGPELESRYGSVSGRLPLLVGV